MTITTDIVDKYEMIQATSKTAEEIVNAIVNKYALELNEYMSKANDYLDQVRDSDRQAWDDGTLQRMAMRLPIILYRLCEGLDRSAIESDMAKASVELVRAQNLIDAPEGTIPERKAYADLKTADDAAVVDLTKHVHARLKSKIEVGNAMFDAIRKIMSARDTDKGVFGREQRR